MEPPTKISPYNYQKLEVCKLSGYCLKREVVYDETL